MLTGIGPLPGIVARVASQTNWFEVAQAKSPAVSATKCQTSRSPAAVATPGPRSVGADDGPRRIGFEHVRQPLARRWRSAPARGFCSTPVDADDPARRARRASRRSGRSCCRTRTGRGRDRCPSRPGAGRRRPRRADTTAPPGRACRPSGPCGCRARCRRAARGSSTRPRSCAVPFGGDRLGQRDARRGGVDAGRGKTHRGRRRTAPTAAATGGRRREIDGFTIHREFRQLHAVGDLA